MQGKRGRDGVEGRGEGEAEDMKNLHRVILLPPLSPIHFRPLIFLSSFHPFPPAFVSHSPHPFTPPPRLLKASQTPSFSRGVRLSEHQ